MRSVRLPVLSTFRERAETLDFMVFFPTQIIPRHLPVPNLLHLARPSLRSDADAVMKNPFHTPEMPINSSLFETRLQGLIAGVNG